MSQDEDYADVEDLDDEDEERFGDEPDGEPEWRSFDPEYGAYRALLRVQALREEQRLLKRNTERVLGELQAREALASTYLRDLLAASGQGSLVTSVGTVKMDVSEIMQDYDKKALAEWAKANGYERLVSQSTSVAVFLKAKVGKWVNGRFVLANGTPLPGITRTPLERVVISFAKRKG